MNLYTKSEKSSGKLGVHTKWLVFNLLQEHSNFTLMPNILNHLICRFMKMYIKKNKQIENHLAKNRGTTYTNTCSCAVYRPGMVEVALNK